MSGNGAPALAAAMHPSRSAPLCKDCRYLDNDRHSGKPCSHPSTPINLVTGIGEFRAETFREPDGKGYRLSGVPQCGPEGRLFVRLDCVPDVLKRGDQLIQPTANVVLQDIAVHVGSTCSDERTNQLGVRLGVARPHDSVD